MYRKLYCIFLFLNILISLSSANVLRNNTFIENTIENTNEYVIESDIYYGGYNNCDDFIVQNSYHTGSVTSNKKKDCMSTLDVVYNKSNINTKKPVVIYIHGGAWTFFHKEAYSNIGMALAEKNYVTVIPQYVLNKLMGSKIELDDQVYDVYKAILWTYDNISKYGGDQSRIILSGHSCGAHLSILTVLKVMGFGLSYRKFPTPLPQLEKLVLFNGPYDDKTLRTAEKLNLIKLGNYITTAYSPIDMLKLIARKSIKNIGFPKITFYYVSNDFLIPMSSAEDLIRELGRTVENLSINNVYIKSVYRDYDLYQSTMYSSIRSMNKIDLGYEEYTHSTLTDGVRESDKKKTKIFLSILEI